MKITSIETSILAFPFDTGGPPLLFAGRPWTHLEILLVKVNTDAGISGWGEAFGQVVNPSTKAALDTLVAPLFIGRDPTNINGLMREFQHTLHLAGRNGPVVYALSGIDIALWDIAGKLANQPLYRLLGGSVRKQLTGYASMLWFVDPKLVARNAERAWKRGYQYIKLHESTREAVLAAKAAVGEDVKLMLDTNCPWSVAESVAMARRMKNDGLYWLEEPVWPPEDHAGLAIVRREGIPIAAGENAAGLFEFKSLFDAQAVDIAQPSVTKVGGITEIRKIIALGEAYGVRVVPHCPYFGPGFLASLHVIAAMPSNPPVEVVLWMDMDMEANPFNPWVRAEGGELRVPQDPGLGCDPDPALLERYGVGSVTKIQ